MIDQPGRSTKVESGVRGTRTLAGLLKPRRKLRGEHQGRRQQEHPAQRRGRGRPGPVFPGQAPRVSALGSVTNPSGPNSDVGPVRRAELDSTVVVNSDYEGERSQTQEHVPLVTLRSLSEVLPVNPARCSQTPITPQGSRKRSNVRTQPHVPSAVATSVSLNRRGCESDGRITGSNPTRKSRGKR